jgi:TonB family protein
MMNAAVLDWRLEQRRNALRALLLSIALHILLILGIAFALSFQPAMETVPREDETLEMVFVDPPAPREERTPYLATTEAQRSETAPDAPAFESDKDTRAASEAPAAGDAPLPTQAGEESPATAFEDRDYTPGDEPRPASPPVPESRPAPPAEQSPAEPMPTPRMPASEIALLQPSRPRETPRPTPVEKPDEPPAPEAVPRRPAPPGFQPQTRVTRLKGNISNRGRAAADAAATPLGRYKKQISDAIGSRWYYYVNDAIGLLNVGTVEIRFVVGPDGTTERVQVLRNSSNESFASTSVRAVVDAEIPPIPPDLLPMLHEEKIEVDFTFTILGN